MGGDRLLTTKFDVHGHQILTSKSGVHGQQILTSKVGPCAERGNVYVKAARRLPYITLTKQNTRPPEIKTNEACDHWTLPEYQRSGGVNSW